MSNTVIDRKKESHSFGFWPAKEEVTTTITLIKNENDTFGILYESRFEGIKDGHVSGGPYEINGNESRVVNNSPKVKLIISNYYKSENTITMTVKITVDIPVIGTETIYKKTLSGDWGSMVVWRNISDTIKEGLSKQKEVSL